MPVTFAISITQPPDDVKLRIEELLRKMPEPAAADFAGLRNLVESNLSVAAGLWGRCFRADERVAIEVVFNGVDPVRADGRSKGAADVGISKRYPGKTLIMEGAAYQIVHHRAPPQPGIVIELPVNDYLTDEMWFDPDAAGGSQDVPDDRVDAVTVFLHEMAHAFGFNGRLNQDPARPDLWGQATQPVVSTFDERVRFHDGNFFFDGPSAVAENGGLVVPLSDRRGNNNDYSHIGNGAGKCPLGHCDLMTGYPWKRGHRYCISRLDLAILQDVGLPIA